MSDPSSQPTQPLTDAGPTFEFGHRPHDNKYSLYIMTTEGMKR